MFSLPISVANILIRCVGRIRSAELSGGGHAVDLNYYFVDTIQC